MILRIVVHITAISLLWENFVEPWAAQFYHQFNKKNINTVLKPMIKKKPCTLHIRVKQAIIDEGGELLSEFLVLIVASEDRRVFVLYGICKKKIANKFV